MHRKALIALGQSNTNRKCSAKQHLDKKNPKYSTAFTVGCGVRGPKFRIGFSITPYLKENACQNFTKVLVKEI